MENTTAQSHPLRIAYLSDIHIDHRAHSTRIPWCPHYPLDLGPSLIEIKAQKPHILLLAGDIGHGATKNTLNSVSYPRSLEYAQQASDYLECPVVSIIGNHEYYNSDFDTIRNELREISDKNVFFLDRDSLIIDLEGQKLRILGTTMWTDYELHGHRDTGMMIAQRMMNDHAVIRKNNSLFKSADALSEHVLSKEWLIRELNTVHVGPTIIMTHHVPHPSLSNPAFHNDALTPAFVSNLDTVINLASDVGVKAWIYGHHHYCGKTEINNVKMLSCQTGYAHEKTGFKGVELLEIEGDIT